MNFPELLFFAVLALLVFGPKRLPEIARNLGKTMADLRRASNEFRQSLEEEFHNLEESGSKRETIDLTPEAIEPYRDSSDEELEEEAGADGSARELPPWESELEEDETFDDPENAESGWMPPDDEEFVSEDEGSMEEEACSEEARHEADHVESPVPHPVPGLPAGKETPPPQNSSVPPEMTRKQETDEQAG